MPSPTLPAFVLLAYNLGKNQNISVKNASFLSDECKKMNLTNPSWATLFID